MDQIAEKARPRGAYRGDPSTALDGRSEGHPGLERSFPVTYLIRQHRRECVLPRLLFPFSERDDLRAVAKPEKPDLVLDLDGGERRRQVLHDEPRPAHQLARALRFRPPELPGH